MIPKTALRNSIVPYIIALGTALAASISNAADIVYDVDIVSGQDSIVGTIITDGKIGVLGGNAAGGPTDFVSWNLELTAGSSTYDDVGPLIPFASTAIGQAVSATATTFSVDFAAIMKGGSDFGLVSTNYGAGLEADYLGGGILGFTLRIPGTEETSIGFHGQPFIFEPDALVQIGQAQVTQAPEIDASSAAAGVTLLAGMLLVFRSRRPLGSRNVTV